MARNGSAEFSRRGVLLDWLGGNFGVVQVLCAYLRRYRLHCLVESRQVDQRIKLVWLDEFSIGPTNVIPVAQLHLIPCPFFLLFKSL